MGALILLDFFEDKPPARLFPLGSLRLRKIWRQAFDS
jgi:hypothetical protein